MQGVAGKGHPLYIFGMVAAIPLLAVVLAASHASSAGSPRISLEQIAQQAEAARTADRTNEAIRLYSQGVGLRPSWSEGWWELGSLYYEQDRFAEADASFRHFIDTARKPDPAYAFLGLCEYETKDYDRSLQHFRMWAGKGWGGTSELIDVSLFHFALLLTRQGKFVESLYLLATEVQRRGRSPALAEAMGLASLRMKQLPEDYPAEQREMVWLAGNSALFAALEPNDFGRADEYAHRLLVHYEQMPNVHYYAGTLLGFEGKKGEAEKEFRRELAVSQQHVATLLQLAGVDLEEDRLTEAVEFAKRAVGLEPENPDTHHVLGRVFLEMDQPQESAKELEIAKQLAPDGATIRSHLAMAYYRLGRKDEAKAEMAAFTALKTKEEVFAPPGERTKAGKPPDPKSGPQE
jgi:tetratricopeptide (TPR) repeat protein